tara:strand:+ start:191 stop:985 length:795 start_codon:yes stop_codon:yes gene_type:complete
VCAGQDAAKTANRNAKIQHRYRQWDRFHKGMQRYSRYKIQKVQTKIEQHNINQGLFRAWNRAQGKLNSLEDKVWKANEKAMIQAMQKSAYGDLLTSGKSGRSIRRFGILEAGALGRYYADNVSKLTDAREKFKAGMNYDRMQAGVALENSFAKAAFAPTPDIAMAAPAMQNTSAALFGDILGFAGTAISIFASDRRLKKDIKKIGKSIDGYNIYRYKYLDEDKEYIGAMADEVIKKNPKAVYRMDNGFIGVDYNQIDVEYREVV